MLLIWHFTTHIINFDPHYSIFLYIFLVYFLNIIFFMMFYVQNSITNKNQAS